MVGCVELTGGLDSATLAPNAEATRNDPGFRRDHIHHPQIVTAPVTHTQSIESYVESWHSRNGLSRDRMPPDAADAFDRETRDLLAGLGHQETVTFDVVGRVTWGLPNG